LICDFQKDGVLVQNNNVGEVFVLKTNNRGEGVKKLFRRIGLNGFDGKKVVLKTNYSNTDFFPASTHPDTLRAIIEALNAECKGDLDMIKEILEADS
jgi:uncharacterized protein (DUF362 family)